MKKSMIIAFVLTVLAAAGAAGTIISLANQAEQVYLTEEVMIGEKKDAEDISFQIRSHWDQKMLWELSADIDEETHVETEFSFHPDGIEIRYDSEAEVSLEYSTNFGYSSSGPLLGENGAGDLPYKAVFEDIAERTENGKERTEVVKLSDYYEYFDVSVDIRNDKYLSRFISYGMDEYKQISEIIAMRVPKELEFEAELTKSEDGNVYEVSGNLQNSNFRIISDGVVHKEGCYMYVSVVDEDGAVVPGLSETGYGIYLLPFSWEKEKTQTLYHDEDEETAVVHYEDFRLVYPLNEALLAMSTDAEEKELFLLITREDRLYLQRVDCKSLALLQEFEMGLADHHTACWDLKVTEQGVLMLMNNGMLYYAEKQGNQYQVTIHYDMMVHDFFASYRWNDYAYDYEDGRLAVIWRDGENYYSGNSAYVFVIENEEMKFLAHYKNSLDQPDDNYDYSNKLHPADPFQITIHD